MLTDLLEITYIAVRAAAATAKADSRGKAAAVLGEKKRRRAAGSLTVTKDCCNLLAVCQLPVSFDLPGQAQQKGKGKGKGKSKVSRGKGKAGRAAGIAGVAGVPTGLLASVSKYNYLLSVLTEQATASFATIVTVCTAP